MAPHPPCLCLFGAQLRVVHHLQQPVVAGDKRQLTTHVNAARRDVSGNRGVAIVAPPEFGRIDLEFSRSGIHQHLGNRAAYRLPDAPVRSDMGLVLEGNAKMRVQ